MTSAAKADAQSKEVIAGLKPCATQKQEPGDFSANFETVASPTDS